MFFSRKKAKIEAAALENGLFFAKALEDLRQEAAAVEKISDAGERYLAWNHIEKKIRGMKKEAAQKTDDSVKKILTEPGKKEANIAGFGTMGAGLVLTGLGLAAVTGGVGAILCAGGFVLAIGGIGVGAAVEGSSPEKLREILDAEQAEFCVALKTLQQQAIQQKEVILQDLPRLYASSHIEMLCERFPAIQAAFAKAAIRGGIFSPPVKLDKPFYPRPK